MVLPTIPDSGDVCGGGSGGGGGGGGPFVRLQSNFPGTPDSGNANVSGQFRANEGIEGRTTLSATHAAFFNSDVANANSTLAVRNNTIGTGIIAEFLNHLAAPVVRINENGTVGINTATPVCALDVGGTVRGQLQDFGGQVFNVKAFGAVGDGVADDTAAIQAAITAAGHGVTFLPAGVYKVTATLDLSAFQGAWLMGAGPGNTIIRMFDATEDVIKMSPDSVTGPVPGTLVTDLWVQPGVDRTAGAMITYGLSENSVIRNVQLGGTDYQNVSAFDTGDGIVCTGGIGSDCQLMFISNFRINIRGPFVGVKGVNAGDFHMAHGYVNGPFFTGGTVVGSRGAYFGNCGWNLYDINFAGFEIGVLVSPPTGASWNLAQNVYCDTNTLYGWDFESGAMEGMSLINCWGSTNGTTANTGTGLRIRAGNLYIIEGFRAVNNGGPGIDIATPANDIEISGGFFFNNSAFANNTKDGIFIGDTVTGLRINDVRSLGIQRYGINISGASDDNFIVTNNDTRGNATGGINNAAGIGASKIVTNNL
jgi:Pectate lyase superfamily protein